MIRPATRADVPALLALLREMAEYERLAQHFHATEDGFAAALFCPAPAAHAALAVDAAGQALGCAVWSFAFRTFQARRVLFVEDVFVTEAARGTGLGYALFRYLAREAVAQDCMRMDWLVLDWNARALAFYDGIGATPPPDPWVGRQLGGAALARLAVPSPNPLPEGEGLPSSPSPSGRGLG